ncbi:hypothetical protein ACI7BZ_05475 [Xanthobacter sp. AM11]|uniref:hypothetical protein n=1 Tax=Xanthobacter sp. AM11 TaxID=3380643 RepID=UPI0039BF273C
MNVTDSLLIPLFDAGSLTGLRHGGLGARYRFWRDEDGARHVFSVYPADAAPEYPDAIAVVTRRTPAGPIAMWAGPTGEAARAAAARLNGEDIHIHVLGDEPAPALRRLLVRSATRREPRPEEGRAAAPCEMPRGFGRRHAA